MILRCPAPVNQLQKGAYPTFLCVLVEAENGPIMETTGGGQLSESIKEDMTMALSDLAGWAQDKAASVACGTACGAADKPEEKPAACGSACGAAGKPEEKPAACGAADKPAEKPAACGSACGSGDK